MAIVNSKDKQLPIPEIIAGALGDMKKSGQLKDYSIETALLTTVREGAMPNTTVEQIGNTVFITHYSEDKNEVAMRALNVDTARNYLDNSIQYVQQLADSGVMRMTSDFDDKRILQLFKSIANRPEFSHWGMKVYNKRDGGMRAFIVMAGK
jgi:hypothetical protein